MYKRITGILSVAIVICAVIFVFTKKDEPAAQEVESQTPVISETQIAKKAQTSDLPDVHRSDWNLLLVNSTNAAEENAQEIISLSNGYEVDQRIVEDYTAFETAAAAAGYPLVMVSAYRSISYQEQIVSESIAQNMSQYGMSEEEARKETMKLMTEPGYSEHHTGLSVDVVDSDYFERTAGNLLVSGYGDEPGAKWIAANAAKYGFIVRYPVGKEEITKIDYEPWHLRYVGAENATYITEHNLCLEEYLDLLKKAGR